MNMKMQYNVHEEVHRIMNKYMQDNEQEHTPMSNVNRSLQGHDLHDLTVHGCAEFKNKCTSLNLVMWFIFNLQRKNKDFYITIVCT